MDRRQLYCPTPNQKLSALIENFLKILFFGKQPNCLIKVYICKGIITAIIKQGEEYVFKI